MIHEPGYEPENDTSVCIRHGVVSRTLYPWDRIYVPLYDN